MKCDHKALFVSREPHNKQDVYAFTTKSRCKPKLPLITHCVVLIRT